MNLEEFRAMKTLRQSLAECSWFATTPGIRIFYPDDGTRTREMAIDFNLTALIDTSCHITENEGSSAISYCASENIGRAVKAATLRHLDKELKEAAALCADEARAILALIEKPAEQERAK